MENGVVIVFVALQARSRSAGSSILVGWVADDGPGIGAADQAPIFERFYKADRTRTSGRGTGLGLAIARHIIEGHGGVIRVESEEGRGATFEFTIPISDAPAEPRPRPPERSGVPARAAGA